MRRRTKIAIGLGATLLLPIFAVAAPIVYVETACRGEAVPRTGGAPLIEEREWQRPITRTFLTYPEWHMVFAYEDFARTLQSDDEHDYPFGASVRSFWQSVCTLTRTADRYGGADAETKQMVYVIGASFNVEMGLKALYENTIGRLTAALRGPQKTAQDELAATMAADYGRFLHQVPWYRFPFAEWTDRLSALPRESARSWERAIGLGLEWRAKQIYADAIGSAAAAQGADELRIRSVVQGLSAEVLASLPGVSVVRPIGSDTIVETDRYAAFTDVARRISSAGGEFVEIAGNEQIMISTLGPAEETAPRGETVFVFAPNTEGRARTLTLIGVDELGGALRDGGGHEVEHVFDY